MNKIYVITKGAYSDYHIVALVSNEEVANKLVEMSNEGDPYDETRIEEYILDDISEDVKNGRSSYFVRMQEDGTVLQVRFEGGFERSSIPIFDMNDNLYQYVLANNEEHAVKIVNERRTSLIAMNQWGS